MAVLSFIDAEILAGALRVTARSNRIGLEAEAANLNVTTFLGSGWEETICGLGSVGANVEGFYDPAAIEAGALNFDGDLWANFRGLLPLTVAPTKADGSVAYIAGISEGGLQLFGDVGDPAPFKARYTGAGALARGALIHPADVLRTAGGTGNGVQLGTLAATRQLLVSVHVLAVTGTTPALTITVQRDDNAGFSSPTTVVVVGPTATPLGQLITVPGPITPDDRYRVIWTLTGTTPSARFAVAVGQTPN